MQPLSPHTTALTKNTGARGTLMGLILLSVAVWGVVQCVDKPPTSLKMLPFSLLTLLLESVAQALIILL